MVYIMFELKSFQHSFLFTQDAKDIVYVHNIHDEFSIFVLCCLIIPIVPYNTVKWKEYQYRYIGNGKKTKPEKGIHVTKSIYYSTSNKTFNI